MFDPIRCNLEGLSEHTDSGWVAQFMEHSLFDLSDPLSADAKPAANLFQSVSIITINTESHADNLFLAFR